MGSCDAAHIYGASSFTTPDHLGVVATGMRAVVSGDAGFTAGETHLVQALRPAASFAERRSPGIAMCGISQLTFT